MRVRMGVKDLELFKLLSSSNTGGPSKPAESGPDLSTAQKLADYLNSKMWRVTLEAPNSTYEFNILGKIDFDRKSFKFTAKDNMLYIKMHIPKNGECDYGLKEIRAEYKTNGHMTDTGGGTTKYYYSIEFNFPYECNGTKYSYLDIMVPHHSATHNEPMAAKVKECSN
jgi:hypothetical protein